MKKIMTMVLLCFLTIGLYGCSKSEVPDFTITVFSVEFCPNCISLKSNLAPLLEKEFKDKVTINYVSVDTEEGFEAYGKITGYYDSEGNKVEGKLKDFNEEYLDQYYVPLVVVDDKYAFLGYDSNFNKDYIKEIKNAVLGKPLSSTLDVDRWYFK